MASVSVRYIVADVEHMDAVVAFYRDLLGFTVEMRPAPPFAMLSRGPLRLVLSAPGGGPGGGAAMPDGTLPTPGGWNRFSVEVTDLDRTVAGLRAEGVRFRNDVVDGVGGRQVLVEDPSGNPVELFEPTRDEARLGDNFEVHPIGHVESALVDPADAPRQGYLGAPSAWLVVDEPMREGIRDVRVDDELLVLTWLHRSRRDELSTVPGDDPTGPERGVFSTRSPARPNPVGLHRVTVLTVADGRLEVSPLEAVDGTPLVDLKPVIHPAEG